MATKMTVTTERAPDCANCANTHDVLVNGVVVGVLYQDGVDLLRIAVRGSGAAPYYGTVYPETDAPTAFDLTGAAAKVALAFVRALPPAAARAVREGAPPDPPARLSDADLYPDSSGAQRAA